MESQVPFNPGVFTSCLPQYLALQGRQLLHDRQGRQLLQGRQGMTLYAPGIPCFCHAHTSGLHCSARVVGRHVYVLAACRLHR